LDLETGRVMTVLNDFLRLKNMHKIPITLKAYKDQLLKKTVMGMDRVGCGSKVNET
jgi:hypothetical protein